MTFELPKLPWPQDALDPYLSANTLGVHYGKHHKTYVTKLNEAVAGTLFEERPLEEIIRATAANPEKAAIFNNGAQHWNHSFFWSCMRPGGGGIPKGALGDRIGDTFGSFEAFKKSFAEQAEKLFGSGWTWLAVSGGELVILQTSNADNPLTRGATPLLALDVWEHAYYLDYQNRRPEFIAAFLDHLVNWEFAERNLSRLER